MKSAKEADECLLLLNSIFSKKTCKRRRGDMVRGAMFALCWAYESKHSYGSNTITDPSLESIPGPVSAQSFLGI